MTFPLTAPIAVSVAQLVDASRPPSHDELSRLFAAVALDGLDPGSQQAGKLKRVRAVLDGALSTDPTAGALLPQRVIQSVAGHGGFRSDSTTFVGSQAVENLRGALSSQGFQLDDEGVVSPTLLDSLEGRELDEALRAYVQRIRRGASDAALVTGSGKDLLEAVARNVVQDHTGSYDERFGFPGTLFQAFEIKGLTAPTLETMKAFPGMLDSDARIAFQQALYLLGTSVNRLRHSEGTGHGRPFPASVTDLEARTAVEIMALISGLLLDS